MDGQITTKAEPIPRGPQRLRAPLAKAISLIATEGCTIRSAAERAGMHEVALHKALRKPHVAAILEQRKTIATLEANQLKGIARNIAIQTGIDLMQNAASEAVRARMVEFFAGEAKQPLVAVQVNNAPIAGYSYPRPDAQSGADAPQVIDAQAIKQDGEE